MKHYLEIFTGILKRKKYLHLLLQFFIISIFKVNYNIKEIISIIYFTSVYISN